MIKKLIYWIRWNFDIIFIVFLFILMFGGIGVVVVATYQNDVAEKAEFMEYCTSKGYDERDCKWEYQRIKNGQRSNVIMMPIFMGK